jgi:pimeloyl-ACP methyl ester carboxylesterase
MTDRSIPRLLLVHRAFHGAWCWEKLLPELDRRGQGAEAVELPFVSAAGDIETVAETIDRLTSDGEPLVVVGHSFGGAVITSAAGGDGGHRAASHLVYLAAIMQDPKEVMDLGRTPGMAAIKFGSDEVSADPALSTLAFYHRCTTEDAQWATARLRPMPQSTLTTPASDVVAWRSVPSTYIVCTDDQIINPEMQRRMAKNATKSIEIDSDHSPFLSCPGALADVLVELTHSV